MTRRESRELALRLPSGDERKDRGVATVRTPVRRFHHRGDDKSVSHRRLQAFKRRIRATSLTWRSIR